MPEVHLNEPCAHLFERLAGQLHEVKKTLLKAGLSVCLHRDVEEFLTLDPSNLRGAIVAPGSEASLVRGRCCDPCHLPLLAVVTCGDVPAAVEAMQAGAFDVVELPADPETLVRKVAAALEHEHRWLHQRLQRLAVRRCLARLSRREAEVLHLLLDGKLNKQIAQSLGVRENTIEVHRSSVMRKLGARTPVELAKLVVATDLPPRRPPNS